jgi:hypothetical protein
MRTESTDLGLVAEMESTMRKKAESALDGRMGRL